MLNTRNLQIVNTLTIAAVLLLILVGGIVRSTGSGMGCPDWPKCFGSYVPPASSNELPENYLDVFKEKRLEKNLRLAKVLNFLGLSDVSEKVLNDPKVEEETEFNLTKAWIEYINRIIGVLIGLFVMANMLFSLSLWSEKRSVFVVSAVVVLLTAFQGWFGSLVVSTNLLHGFITIHMLLALAILALLIWMRTQIKNTEFSVSKSLYGLSIFCLVMIIIQILLGTEVRGMVDEEAERSINRENWIQGISTTVFFVHRSFSWILVLSSGSLVWLIRRKKLSQFSTLSILLMSMICIAVLLGVGLTRLDFPFWMQPLHLLIATCIFSVIFYLTLRFKFKN